MSRQYTRRATKITVLPADDPLFSEMATTIEIEDEGGGEFVTVAQNGRVDHGKVSIEVSEWEALRDAIDEMIKRCRPRASGE